jgi:hypothetical protein
MSYDFAIREKQTPSCECCGRNLRHHVYIDLGSPTYNVGDIFRLLGCRDDFGSSVDWTLDEAETFFRSCLDGAAAAAGDEVLMAKIKELEPDNGWGNLRTVEHAASTVLAEIGDIRKAGGVKTRDVDTFKDSLGYEWGEAPDPVLVPIEDLRFTS